MNPPHATSLDQVPLSDESEGAEIPDDAPHWRREHFIPLRKADLVRLLADDAHLAGIQRQQFLQLCTLLNATFHYMFHELLEELKDLYAPFDPDSVTAKPHAMSPEQREELVPRLFDGFVRLLKCANYHRLTRDEIGEAAKAASDWGVRLKVDFDAFERMEVYARGDIVSERTRRHWRNRFRVETVEVPIYQRLIVMFRIGEARLLEREINRDAVYIKIFKNIPKQDLDMLLPGTHFHMTLLDRGKILLPTLSGVAIAAIKLAKGALLVAFAGFYGMLAFLGLVGGTIGYGVKSFLGYLRTKDKYQLSLTRSLYYQNLDNNAGVLYRLLDDAEEQEFREAVLAYALLRRKAGPEGWPIARLDREAEAYLSEVLGFHVDFEVHDALDKLERLGCAEKTQSGRWRAVPLEQALVQLDRAWDDCFRHHSHEEIGGDR
jgi:hypothetical protein